MKQKEAHFELTKKVPRLESDQESTFGMIMLLANRFQTKLDSYTGELTLKQWLLLCMLDFMKTDTASLNDLAAAVGYSRQNVKKITDILVTKGYMELKPSALDKRAYEVKLTKKAKLFFEEFEEKGDWILSQLFKGISGENLATTYKTLETILNNIETMQED